MTDEKSPLIGKTALELLKMLKETSGKESRIAIIREISNTWDILAVGKLEELALQEKDEDIAREIKLSIDEIRTANSQEINIVLPPKQNLPLTKEIERMEAIIKDTGQTLVICFGATLFFWLLAIVTMNGFAIAMWITIGTIASMINSPVDIKLRGWAKVLLCILSGATSLVFIICYP